MLEIAIDIGGTFTEPFTLAETLWPLNHAS